MDWWLEQNSPRRQHRHPSVQVRVGNLYTFPELGSRSVTVWESSGKSSVEAPSKQWKGRPSNKSKLALGTTWTCKQISPAPKSRQRFSTTPRVDLVLVLALDIIITWLDRTGRARSSHTRLGMATISEPELRTPRIDWPVPTIFASRDRSGTEWCATISPSSLWCMRSPKARSTSPGSCPASSLTCTVLVETGIHFAIDKSLSCLQTLEATAMSSRTGTGTVVARTRSKRCFGAVSSSRGNKYLNCPWGLKEEVLAESFRNGIEVDGGVEEGGLFATGAGTFGGVADLDRMASNAGETTSSATNTAWEPAWLVFRAGISTPSNRTRFSLSFLLAWKPAQALAMYVCLKIWIGQSRVRLFVQILINRSHEDRRFDV